MRSNAAQPVFDDGRSVAIPSIRRARAVTYQHLDFGPTWLAPISGDGNDPDTVHDAVVTRMLRDHKPARGQSVWVMDEALLGEFGSFVASWIAQNVQPVHVMSFEEWMESTNYSSSRKAELRALYNGLQGGRPSRRECRKVKMFIKREGYLVWDKACRCINSRVDIFKAYSGRFFKSIEEHVYSICDPNTGRPYFIKHVPVSDRAELVRKLKQAGCTYLETDYTAFESGYSKMFMDVCECALYKAALAHYPKDARLIADVISGRNICSTRGKVVAIADGRRMSGDMCTSLGNGFTNLMLSLFAAHKCSVTLTGHVEGDDGLFAASGPFDSDIPARLGFELKVKEHADPCLASFCGLIFASPGQVIKDPVKFLANFGWSGSYIGAGPSVRKALLRGKAISTIVEVGNCPVLGAIARAALAATEGVEPRYTSDGYHVLTDVGCADVPFSPTLATRELFSHRYGVSVETQRRVESMCFNGDVSGAYTVLLRELPELHPSVEYARAYVQRVG